MEGVDLVNTILEHMEKSILLTYSIFLGTLGKVSFVWICQILSLFINKHEPCKRSWCPMIKPCKFWFEYICFLALFFFHFYFSLNFNFFCFNCLYPIIMTIPLVGLGGRNWSYGKCPKFHSFLYGFPQPCGRKLKEHKYTQPLIGTPESFSDWSLESQSQL